MTSRSMLRKLAVLMVGALAAAGASARTEIQNKGSDTLVNAAQSLAEQYGKVNPKVAVAVSGGGSGTGIAAMINGTVDIANSSRKMSEKEIKEAQAKGRQPVEHIIGYDALAIFVHKNFPGDSISISDLAKIYGRDGGASKWSDLGITIPGCKGEIVVVSRNCSETHSPFLQWSEESAEHSATHHVHHVFAPMLAHFPDWFPSVKYGLRVHTTQDLLPLLQKQVNELPPARAVVIYV